MQRARTTRQLTEILWRIAAILPEMKKASPERPCFHQPGAFGLYTFLRAMNSTHHLLECRDLARELSVEPPRYLVKDINFSVDCAEVLGVIGPSGAGKSTLLRLINRLDELTQGTVLFNGQDYRFLD